MVQKKQHQLIIASAVLFTALTLTSCTGNWPQFRGPEYNMIATGKNLPAEWSEDNNVQWTYEIDGDSWSSPVVWGNKVFVASAFPVEVSDTSYLEDVYRWQVACVDLETGEELWKQVAFEGNPRIKKHPATNYAGETPVTDGKRLYVYFGMTGLFCYDMDGGLLWKKDLGAYDTQNGWGTGSSPVIFKDVLYVQVDNEENSFDAASGDLVYKQKVENAGACWASPWVHEDKIYFFGEKGVTSVFKAGKEFELLHQNSLDDKFWASVAIMRDAYILKGTERLYCIGG
ncbi:MAG: PQQ-binding-like beta-propeller repeat protein [Bacteroidales bacterium]|nr:PQQ-binding-like beta-propeller repeat protein [Bacteroidales bacterium]